MTFAVEGDRAYVRHHLADLAIEVPRQHNEYSLAVGLNTMRLMAGSRWAPEEVQFAHPEPRDTSEQTRVVRRPRVVRLADECARHRPRVLRSSRAGGRPAAVPDPAAVSRQGLEGDAARGRPPPRGAEGHRGGDARWRPARSRRWRRRSRRDQRTLQRQPEGARRGFPAAGRRHASPLLAQLPARARSTRSREIACLLGYSEVSAFNRAFKRWTGSTPSDYRRKSIR